MRSRSEQTAPTPPPLAGRVHYLVGGMLAPRELEWVRKDLTGPGWRHRQAARQVLLMLPVAIAFAFLPGQASVRVSIPLGLLLIAVVMGYTTANTSVTGASTSTGSSVPSRSRRTPTSTTSRYPPIRPSPGSMLNPLSSRLTRKPAACHRTNREPENRITTRRRISVRCRRTLLPSPSAGERPR